MKSGIYQICNTYNKHRYIGSSNDVVRRILEHDRKLKANKHHSIYLQRAWNLYGSNSFEFKILELCNLSDLLDIEQFYLDSLTPEYNISPSARTCRGIKRTSEYKEKMKVRLSGRKLSLSHKEAISLGLSSYCRKIESINPKTGLVTEYASILDASRHGYDRSCIAKCLKGERIIHSGLYWNQR